MKINWLLEEEIFAENLQPLVDEIKRQGFGCKTTKYIPYDLAAPFRCKGRDENTKTIFKPSDCVVVYGSLQMARCVQRYAEWIPGVYLDLEKYACTSYYPAFGELLLNSHYVMLPFGELLRRKDFLIDTMSADGCVFIRPSSGYKLFTGEVVKCEEWAREVEKFNFYDIDPSEVVVVAEPYNLIAEWRFVVVDNNVITGSQYRNEYGSKLDANIPEEVLEYAQQAAKKYSPNRAWCLDICQTKQGKLYVLEIGSFSSAGLYVCPMEPIVREISRIALEEWHEHM